MDLTVVLKRRGGAVITTMHDVAKRAGLSISTVSHVINNSRAVSIESRQRVMSAMEELGYKPNALARSLRRRKSNTLGMIMPDSSNPFFAEVARAIEDASFAKNYSVILCNSDGDLEKQQAYTNVLIENRVAGILFVAAGISTELVNDLEQRRVPLVVVDREVPGAEVDTVMTNHAQGGFLATQHLIDLGHGRIACIAGNSEVSPSAERLTGYQRAIEENNLAYDDRLVVKGDFQYESGYQATTRLLALEDPPSAVFACNDLMAVGCISAARQFGLRVPDELSVVGFDNVRLASFTNPPLTTIAQPIAEIGTLATRMLLERMLDLESPPRFKRLDTILCVRRSTAAPAKR
jgi:LacI family transcriptional regulator